MLKTLCRRLAFLVGVLPCFWRADGAGLVLGVDPKPSGTPPPLEVRRELQLEKTDTAPTLDGKLDDACWRTAASTGDLRVKSGGKFQSPFPKKTTLRAVYDDTTLYLAFECFDPDIKNLLATYTGRDGKYWLDDDIELMVDANYDRRTFRQFLFNAIAGRTEYAFRVEGERILSDGEYTPEWRLKTKICADRWVAELALPFRSLGIDSVVPGSRWGFNFCRIENPGCILGNWTRALNHRDPRLFGDLVFGRAPYALGTTDFGAQACGVNLLRATVANNTDAAKALAVAATLSAEGVPVSRSSAARTVAPGKNQTLFLTYELDADTTVDLALSDPQWRQTIMRRRFHLSPRPPMMARMDSIEYYERDRVARVHLDVHVGDVTAVKGRLLVALLKGETRLAEAELNPIPVGRNVLRLDVANLKQGAYTVAVTVAGAGGATLASKRMVFSKTKSLLDF